MIIVSQKIIRSEQRGETCDALDQALTSLLSDIGLLPAPLPNGIHERGMLREWLQRLRPRGIVLSGGNDLGEYPERDATERELIIHAIEVGVPLLGICRGMQMLGSWAGAELKRVVNHVRQRHVLSGEIQGEVNSFHNFSLSKCPQDFSVVARSEDGEIEAIRHRDRPLEGWMWHPERESVARKSDLMRLREMFCG